MSNWLDSIAKASARRAAKHDAAEMAVSAAADGVSRRDVLKRAGVVGAVLWTAPVIQSMSSPAFAATSPPANGTCKGASDMSDGPCGGSGGCPKCGANKVCTSHDDCISGTCNPGKGNGKAPGLCAKSGTGQSCYGNSDCTTGVCGAYTNGVGVCQQASGIGACTSGADCASGVCTNGVCAKSASGQKCSTSKDCSTGLVCKQGVCRK